MPWSCARSAAWERAPPLSSLPSLTCQTHYYAERVQGLVRALPTSFLPHLTSPPELLMAHR